MINAIESLNNEDILFKESNEDCTQNAVVRAGLNFFILYSEGYKNAALKIWQSFDGSAGQANTLVYPIIFLNRHFLELRLKEIIGGLNYTINGKFYFSKGHDLANLWGEYKNLLTRFEENYKPEKSLLRVVEKLIKEFNAIDPDSYSRYPVDKEKQPAFKITNLDLQNFMQTMKKLYDFFEIQSDLAYYLKDQTEEYIQIMEAELASNYFDYYD